MWFGVWFFSRAEADGYGVLGSCGRCPRCSRAITGRKNLSNKGNTDDRPTPAPLASLLISFRLNTTTCPMLIKRACQLARQHAEAIEFEGPIPAALAGIAGLLRCDEQDAVDERLHQVGTVTVGEPSTAGTKSTTPSSIQRNLRSNDPSPVLNARVGGHALDRSLALPS